MFCQLTFVFCLYIYTPNCNSFNYNNGKDEAIFILPSLLFPSSTGSNPNPSTAAAAAAATIHPPETPLLMDLTNSPSPQKKPNQILGPRPSALKLNPDSHKIKKPPLPPPRHQPPQLPQQPLIIYAVSPKIIHTEASNFMSVVQRLTGLSSSDFSSSDPDLSPAARLAVTERASPRDHTHKFNTITTNTTTSDNIILGTNTGCDSDDILAIIEELAVGQAPGILSPGPGMLPPVPPGFFSPASDPNALSFLNDFVISPSLNGGGGNGSGFFPASIVSPLASPDIVNLLMDL